MTQKLVACTLLAALGLGMQDQSGDSLKFEEVLKPGTAVEVASSVNLQGSITDSSGKAAQANPMRIQAHGQSHYRERITEVNQKKEISAVVRRYLEASVEKQRGESKQVVRIRPDVERIAVQRADDQNTLFSPDAPLTGPELDLLRAEVFLPALRGLLPTEPSKVGDQWTASTESASELTGVDPVESGRLQCTLREVKSNKQGSIARIVFSGTLVGPTDQGPARMSVDGFLLFDLDLMWISQVVMNGKSEIMDGNGRIAGRLDGRYELTRKPSINDPRLTDSALEQIELNPTPANTALVFDGSTMGIRFLYPRNWELQSVSKKTIQLDEPTGGNMLLSVDSEPAPTAAKLRSDLVSWLKQQKATVKQEDPIESQAVTESRRADHFRVRAEHQRKDKEWTYLIIREGGRSLAIGANLLLERADALRNDLTFVAASATFLDK